VKKMVLVIDNFFSLFSTKTQLIQTYRCGADQSIYVNEKLLMQPRFRSPGDGPPVLYDGSQWCLRWC
jgi:hypothetical protein